MSNHAPANCKGVMAVAATNRAGARASYSNFGSGVDIAAPGGDKDNPVWSLSNMGTAGPGADALAVVAEDTDTVTLGDVVEIRSL